MEELGSRLAGLVKAKQAERQHYEVSTPRQSYKLYDHNNYSTSEDNTQTSCSNIYEHRSSWQR